MCVARLRTRMNLLTRFRNSERWFESVENKIKFRYKFRNLKCNLLLILQASIPTASSPRSKSCQTWPPSEGHDEWGLLDVHGRVLLAPLFCQRRVLEPWGEARMNIRRCTIIAMMLWYAIWIRIGYVEWYYIFSPRKKIKYHVWNIQICMINIVSQ